MKQVVVFDTNVLISGYLWKGKPRQVLRLIKSSDFFLLICKESMDELVSGDSHLLKLKRYSGIEIITVDEFMKRYSK